MFEHYLNNELFETKITPLIPDNIIIIDCVAVEIKGHTIVKDCTKLVFDGIRYDYINNQLIKI